MANGTLTSNGLITDAKRRASIPNTQTLFSDTDFLAFANEEMGIGIVPEILKVHEEYFVYPETVALVANTSNYSIPYRAIGGKFRDIFYKDTNGNLSALTRITADNKADFQSTNLNTRFIAYYIQGNDIIIAPDVGENPTGSLVFTYYLRPNELVAEERVAVVTAINVVGDNTVYTVDGIPYSSGTIYMATSDLLDILQVKPGYKTRKFDLSSNAIDVSLKTITFATSDLPLNVEVGDHITFAGECIIPQIPTELHVMLSHRIATRVLESLGDPAGLQAANAKLAEMEAKTSVLIDSRVDGDPIKVTNYRGLLRSSKIGRRYWR